MSSKAYMTICSERTLQSNEKGFFLQFADSVAQAAGEKWIKDVFGKLKTDQERIRILYSEPTIKDVVLKTLSHVQEIYRRKSAEVSQARRLDAEKAHKSGDSNRALLFASQSVLRAPRTGENSAVDNGISLALALWTRSEILMHLKQYSFALSDLQLALKENLHNSYKAEAFWRMAICYKASGEEKRATVSAELAEKLIKDAKKIDLLKDSMKVTYQELKKDSRKVMPSIVKPHKSYLNATHKMLVKQSKEKGRFIVAGESISTGEVIVCEPPYVACLLPDCFGTHCHHCFERLEAPIGCPDCSNVAFCKKECRDIAIQTYHKYECKFLDLLMGSGMSILAHTALRMITQNTPERMYDVNENRSLESIYSLCTLSDKRSCEDYLQRSLMAAFLLRCLQKSGYFGYIDDNVVPNENQLGIGELLLFHLQMLQFNAHEIYETKCNQTNHRFRNAVANYIGVAVYPTVSLFNHNCSPTLCRYFVGKNIVLKATKPFVVGEEINENYGPIFSRKTLPQRQHYLEGRYWFKCECLACTQNWPTLDNGLAMLSKRVKCPTTKCNYYFTLPQKADAIKCPRCKNRVKLAEHAMLLQNCEEQYSAGFLCMDQQEVEKGIQLLCHALDTFHKVSAPPHKDTHLGQECLRALFADSGNVHQVAKH